MPYPRRSAEAATSYFSARLTPGERQALDGAALARASTPRDLVRAWIAAGCPMPGTSSSSTAAPPDPAPPDAGDLEVAALASASANEVHLDAPADAQAEPTAPTVAELAPVHASPPPSPAEDAPRAVPPYLARLQARRGRR